MNKLKCTKSYLAMNFSEVIRYGIVGVIQNGTGYIIYLVLTWIGLDPKLVVAFSYPVAMYISYQGNKEFTFAGRNGKKTAFKYLLSHFVAYFLNLSMLYYFSDVLGYPHQMVQLVSIAVVAIYLFVTFKKYVFVLDDNNER